MAYTKTNWVNGSAPPISAENLNKIEDGIYNNDADIATLNSQMAQIPIIDYGYESFGSVANQSYSDVSITFNKTFSAPPNVTVGLYGTSTAYAFGNCALGCHTISKTGCKARFWNNSGSSRAPGVYWIAMGT